MKGRAAPHHVIPRFADTSHRPGLVTFSEYLEAQTSPITSIPEEYLGVIAKLTHEK